MNKVLTVIKNELIRYFVSPLAYVYLFCFVILNASFATYFGNFFNRGQADLLAMFAFQPWLYLLFIPGISMRLWAEEFHSKTIVQIATMPISITALVLGKFFAAWIFSGIALLLTFPFWITINALGTPDNFVIFMGYCASFVLAGCMLSISQIMSALTKNQIIALVLAVIANLLFFWSGIEYVLSFFRPFLPDAIIDVIASFSFITHFNTITHGLLSLSDVIFLLSLIIFGNYTTILIINFKTAGTSGWLKSGSKSYTIVAWILLLIGFFGINIISDNLAVNLQYDGTAEKNFTLTQNTANILKNLKEPVTARLYFSPVLGQRNSELREQFDNIRILLHKYKNVSGGNFDYKVYYPEFLSKEEDLAIADGVQSIPLIDINQTALFGMTVEDSLQNKAVIPFFATSQFGRLEQDITSKIHQLSKDKKKIGVLSSIPVFGRDLEKEGAIYDDTWEIIKMMDEDYHVHRIMSSDDFDKYQFDAVIIIYPKSLTDDTLNKVKDYARNGGKIVLILDPANEASRLYAPVQGKLEPSDSEFFENLWNFKFYKDYVVADLENSITVDATTDYTKNPVFSQDVIQFRLHSDAMNPKHPITYNLQEIMMASATAIMPDLQKYRENKIAFYPLLKAGDISAMIPASNVIDGLNPQDVLENFRPDEGNKFMAAEIIGLEPENPYDVVVFADTDFLYDRFWMDKVYLLDSEYVTAIFDNANLLFNTIDYLVNDYSLLGLRGKRVWERRFDDIELMRRLNSLQYKQKEREIFEKIEDAKRSLQEVWGKKAFEGRESFTADEMAALSQIRNRLTEYKKQLSEVRGQAYNDISTVAAKINFLNIWVLPICFGVILLLILFIRFIRRKKSFALGLHINRRLCLLAAVCALIFLGAMISIYAVNRSNIDSYENKPVFPQLMNQLNSIDNIVLKTNKTELNFKLKDGVWVLESMPYLPVYQERIRRFLTTVADARYFARKSDKAENLAMFNLLPIEDEKSEAISVDLNSAGKAVQHFLLGDTDVDIGRSSKAAYMRFDDQFQVWEISADFVDMDLDWHKWTYSNIWDLRYGRPYDRHQNPKDEMYLTNLVKVLLNVPFEEVIDKPAGEPQKILKLDIEGGNYVDIAFYKTADKAYITYSQDKNNPNKHLKLLQQFLGNKAAVIDTQKMEMLLEIIK